MPSRNRSFLFNSVISRSHLVPSHGRQRKENALLRSSIIRRPSSPGSALPFFCSAFIALTFYLRGASDSARVSNVILLFIAINATTRGFEGRSAELRGLL